MSAIKRELNEVLDEQALVQLPVVMPVSTSSVALGTLQASNPAALVAGAAELASQLAIVINKQNLATVIKGKRFVNVEGWTTLATMLGVTAREVCTVEADGVYTATVELVRMSDGACISRARGRNRVSEKNVAKENKCVTINKIWTEYLHLNCVKTLGNPVSMLYRH